MWRILSKLICGEYHWMQSHFINVAICEASWIPNGLHSATALYLRLHVPKLLARWKQSIRDTWKQYCNPLGRHICSTPFITLRNYSRDNKHNKIQNIQAKIACCASLILLTEFWNSMICQYLHMVYKFIN